jgi:uncharacterized membrane protein YadS
MNELDLTAINAVAIVPIIVALTQVLKMAFPSEGFNKYAPIVAIVLGLLASFLFNNDKMEWEQMVMGGILYGLSASGLYSSTKSTAHAIKDENGTGGTGNGSPRI